LARYLALALLVAPAAWADAGRAKPPLEITELGIFCPVMTDGTEAAPDTATGTIDLLSRDEHVDLPETRVPAKRDLSFGIRYRLTPGTPDQIGTVIVTHPPMGRTGRTRQSWQTNLSASVEGITTYSFDYPEELLIGRWTMQIDVDGQILFVQDFDIVPPAQAPAALTLCFDEDVIS
jgi:hypothetical protein